MSTTKDKRDAPRRERIGRDRPNQDPAPEAVTLKLEGPKNKKRWV